MKNKEHVNIVSTIDRIPTNTVNEPSNVNDEICDTIVVETRHANAGTQKYKMTLSDICTVERDKKCT